MVCHKSFKNFKRTKEELTELTVTHAASLFLANYLEKLLEVHKYSPHQATPSLPWRTSI